MMQALYLARARDACDELTEGGRSLVAGYLPLLLLLRLLHVCVLICGKVVNQVQVPRVCTEPD